MAAMALRWGKDDRVVISSFDSDLFQLIGPRVSILRYRGEASQLWDLGYFESRFGIFPAKYPDHKALTGDASDNITGLKGVGPKTATKLLQRFSSLEDILENTDKVEKESLRQTLLENTDRLRRNYQMICLNDAYMPPFEKEQLRWSGESFTTRQVLKALELM